jgi:hypothetical protein
VIGGGELARLALERRVRREVDPLPDPKNIGRAVVLHHRHRFERARHELQRPREVVVIEHRLVNVLDDRVGRGIGCPLRVEARLGGVEEHAQHFRLVGRIDARARPKAKKDGENDAAGRAKAAGSPAATVAFIGEAHSYNRNIAFARCRARVRTCR